MATVRQTDSSSVVFISQHARVPRKCMVKKISGRPLPAPGCDGQADSDDLKRRISLFLVVESD